MESLKKNTVFIEKVSNGFIVHENYQPFEPARNYAPEICTRKVFNTKKQLNNYLNENM